MSESTLVAPMIGALRRKLPALLRYFTSTAAVTIGHGSQIITLAFLARYLGVHQFAALTIVMAASTLALNVCGLGSGETLMRRLASDRGIYPALLGHGLLVTLATGVLLTAIVVAALYLFAPQACANFGNLTTLTAFVFTTVTCYRWLMTTEQIFLGLGQFSMANVIVVLFGIARALCAAIATFIFTVDTLSTWALWHIFIHLAAVGLCAGALLPLGRPQWILLRDELVLGAHFCSSYFFRCLPDSVDRLMLGVVAAPAIVASYSLAARITNTSHLTVNGFTRLRYTALAKASQESISSLTKAALRNYLPAVLCLGFATSVGLYVIAPALPVVFGKDYGNMVSYLRIGCWLVTINAASTVPYDALGAASHHALRARIVNVSSLLTVVGLIVLTYSLDITGLFIALYVGQLGTCGALWFALLRLNRRRSAIAQPGGTNQATKSAGKRVLFIVAGMMHFRLEFHRHLRDKLAARNIHYDVAMSDASPHLSGRDDTRSLEFGRKIESRWLKIGNVTLCWQHSLLSALSYDLVIVMHENKYLINYALQLLRGLGGPKLAFYGHGCNFQTDPTRWRERFKRLLMKNVDWWFAYTALSQRLVASSGYSIDRITNVENAYDTLTLTNELSAISAHDSWKFRKRFGIKSNNVGIYVGAFYKEKRIGFLIACAERIRAEIDDFELLLVGGGPDIGLAKAAAAMHPWIHVTGPLFGLEKAVALKSSKIFLLPGLVGLAILDSFAAGVPMVTVDYPYHSPEIAYLRHGENGLIVSPGNDVELFARAVVELLRNEGLRSSLAAAALADAARYNANTMTENFVKGIDAALATKRV